MHLGLQLPTFPWPGGPQRLGVTFGRVAEQAERAGFYSLWTMDHVLGPPSVGSTAFLLLVERLTPNERAVFLLHKASAYRYEEIAEIIGKSPVNDDSDGLSVKTVL